MTVTVDGLTFRVGSELLVDSVGFHCPPGTVTALTGPNGAGKSTLLHLIAGTKPASAGSVHLGETDAATLGRRARARRISLVEQDSDAEVALPVREVVLLGRTPHRSILAGPGRSDTVISEEALETVGMTEFADRNFSTLSGGERQRVHLARALAQQPELLLLDEPTNHLDISAQLSTLALLRRVAGSGVTVIAALHDLSLASAYSDRTVVLSSGRVAAAGPTEDTLTPGLIESVFRVRAVRMRHPKTGKSILTLDPLPDPDPDPALRQALHPALRQAGTVPSEVRAASARPSR